MRIAIALVLGAVLPLIGLNGVSPAQAQSGVEIKGTLEAVDCQEGTVTMNTTNGSATFVVDNNTAALVGETTIPFCSLEGYIGAPVAVWLVAYGGDYLAAQIEVTGPPPALPYRGESINPVPIWGVVLGTIIVAGLLYLIVRGPDNVYYRYPYYGAYYRCYYHYGYRPYVGYYPASTQIIVVARPVIGIVLGTVVVNNYEYILARDGGGYFYRYPHYGPYRQVYYQSPYRPFTGSYSVVNVVNNVRVTNVVHVNNIIVTNVQVRQGDSHWDAPAAFASTHPTDFRGTPARGPVSRPASQTTWQPPQRERDAQPAWQPPQRQVQPTYQPTPWQPPQRERAVQPAWQPPQRERAVQPTYQPAPRQPQRGFEEVNGNGRGNPHGITPADQCKDRTSNQSCPTKGRQD